MDDIIPFTIKQDDGIPNTITPITNESTRIISFNPNNNGQIIITPVQTKQEPMFITPNMTNVNPLSNMSPSHLSMNNLKTFNNHNPINPMFIPMHLLNNTNTGNSSSSDDDDKRSINSSGSIASMSTTFGSHTQTQTSTTTTTTTKNTKLEYACEHCGKSFKHKSNLKIHFIIHTPEALSCKHCDKKFARKSNLTQHLRVHTGERPYICQFCNKSFKQSHRYFICQSYVEITDLLLCFSFLFSVFCKVTYKIKQRKKKN